MANEHAIETFNRWEKDSKTTDCLIHRFWAGRLSIAASLICNSRVSELSENVYLLSLVNDEYNRVIEEETLNK